MSKPKRARLLQRFGEKVDWFGALCWGFEIETYSQSSLAQSSQAASQAARQAV